MAAAVCVEHKGKHGVFEGRCVLVGREVRRPFSFRASVCETCGLELELRRDNATGRTERLVSGTDRLHVHAPAVTVRLDADELAQAIVAASRAARQERQPVQRREADPIDPQSTLSGRVPATGNGRQPPTEPSEQSIPTVTVWNDDGAGS